MSQFTMFGFDGLRGLGRIKRGHKQGQQKFCGCHIERTKNKQPYAVCPGSPMRKFLPKAQAAEQGKQEFCTWLVKPVHGRKRHGRRS